MNSTTICITTFNRPVSLNALLGSIYISDVNNYADRVALLICNNSRTPINIPQGLSQIISCKVLNNEHTSAGSARNKLGFSSKSDYLTFIDDDTTLAPDYFKQLFNVIDSTDTANLPGIAGLVKRQTNNSVWDRAWLDAGFDRYFELPNRFPKLKWACSANLTVNTSLFRKTSGFREGPVPVGGEDIDFGLRVNTDTLHFVSGPNVISYHEPIEQNINNQLQRKAFLYGCSEQWLAQLYPQHVVGAHPENLTEILSFINSAVESTQLKGYFLLGGFNQALVYGNLSQRISATQMARAL